MAAKPEVTLLGAFDFVQYTGRGKMIHFKKGITRGVPEHLARRLRKLKDKKGAPMFEVKGIESTKPEQNVRGEIQFELPI